MFSVKNKIQRAKTKIPMAQGKPGRNGQTILGIAISSNAKLTNVSEVGIALLQIGFKLWHVSRDPYGGQSGPPKMMIFAYLGSFRTSLMTLL